MRIAANLANHVIFPVRIAEGSGALKQNLEQVVDFTRNPFLVGWSRHCRNSGESGATIFGQNHVRGAGRSKIS